MASVPAIQQSIYPTRSFSVSQPEQVNLTRFNAKFNANRSLLLEDTSIAYGDASAIVVPGIGAGIALLAVHVKKVSQQVDWYCGYHITTETDPNDISDFMKRLDDKNYDLHLYLTGGDSTKTNHETLLSGILDAIKSTFKKNHIASQQIDLINARDAKEKVISVALTEKGHLYWCYGKAD